MAPASVRLAEEQKSIGGLLGGLYGGLSTGFLDGLYKNKILLFIPFILGIILAFSLKIL